MTDNKKAIVKYCDEIRRQFGLVCSQDITTKAARPIIEGALDKLAAVDVSAVAKQPAILPFLNELVEFGRSITKTSEDAILALGNPAPNPKKRSRPAAQKNGAKTGEPKKKKKKKQHTDAQIAHAKKSIYIEPCNVSYFLTTGIPVKETEYADVSFWTSQRAYSRKIKGCKMCTDLFGFWEDIEKNAIFRGAQKPEFLSLPDLETIVKCQIESGARPEEDAEKMGLLSKILYERKIALRSDKRKGEPAEEKSKKRQAVDGSESTIDGADEHKEPRANGELDIPKPKRKRQKKSAGTYLLLGFTENDFADQGDAAPLRATLNEIGLKETTEDEVDDENVPFVVFNSDETERGFIRNNYKAIQYLYDGSRVAQSSDIVPKFIKNLEDIENTGAKMIGSFDKRMILTYEMKDDLLNAWNSKDAEEFIQTFSAEEGDDIDPERDYTNRVVDVWDALVNDYDHFKAK